MPPLLGNQSAQSPVHFLNTVLAQGGPNALPYEESVKITIRSHLVALLDEFPSLQVRVASFTHNDGKTVHLLQADGTVPMYYLEVMYNIPVTLWLLENYPKNAPRVFVTPTRDMIIKRPHRHVDASGLVSVPYLQNWVYPRSNLVELVRILSLNFGQDPPVYSKPRPRTPTSSVSSIHTINPLHTGGVVVSQPPSQFPGGQSQHPLGLSSLTQQQHVYPPYRHQFSSSEEFRINSINVLTERLQRDAGMLRKTKEMDMDALVNTQGVLKQREAQCKQGIQRLQREKELLECHVQAVLTNTDVLETWLKENEKCNVQFDIDDTFEPCDPLSRQLLECTSADLAIEDLLYALDKAVHEAAMSGEVYLKQVRTLSREQFFHRAMAGKIRAAQTKSHGTAIAGFYPS